MARLLLVNAIDPRSELQARFPSLGLGYLAAYIQKEFRKDSFKIQIVNDGFEDAVKGFKPHIVGITAVSQNFEIAKKYAKYAHDSGIYTIVGGAHISAMPNCLTDDMDVGVIGEGEETICDLLNCYMAYGYFPKSDLEDVRGIVFRHKSGCLHVKGPRPLIDPLDDIPHPVRDKVLPTDGIFSSRGCPYRCYFCFSSRFWNKVRYFSAEYVVEELKELSSRGARRISFHDDLMMADLNRLHDLVELINREKSLKNVKFRVNARANLINEHTAWMLSQMHVDTVGLGLESGNKRVLAALKGRIRPEDGFGAIAKLHKNRIAANASFVIGYPDETEEEIEQTLNFIKESDVDFIDVYILTPFPGTPAWEDAEARGMVSSDMDWSRLNVDYNKNPNPVILSTLGKDVIDKYYKKLRRHRLFRAARRIYFNPMFGDVCRAGWHKALKSLGGNKWDKNGLFQYFS